MFSVESKGEKRMVNSEQQILPGVAMSRMIPASYISFSYGSHLVNKMVKLAVGMEDLKVQRVKNPKKTTHLNFECCRYFC